MPLALALLGTFEIRRDGLLIHEFRAQSVRALLAYLALEANRPHEREHLCALLWPDDPLPAALTNLRQALHRLRQALEPPGEEGRYLLITRQTVQLNPATIESDVSALDAALRAVATHKHRSATHCAQCAARSAAALPLYRGELLPGFSLPDSAGFEHWLDAERERLHAAFCSLLDQVAAAHEHCGDFSAALPILRRWVELDPWNETAHLRLISALAYTGQRTTALRQFERYRAILAAELRIEPSLAACSLRSQIQSGNLVAPQVAGLRHAPAALTPFFGRTADLAELLDRLQNPACRLITITGMGGSGKTRLALAAAQVACHSFADGAVFVPLAAVEDADQVVAALSSALNLPFGASAAAPERLWAALRERELLVLLDNCEQVAGLGALVVRLLGAAPRLTILATSRAPLDLRAEWVLALGGLEMPPVIPMQNAAQGVPIHLGASVHADYATGIGITPPAADPQSYPAGQLFLQIARQVQPGFQVDPAGAAHIQACCTLLDGSPLAIELAASRLRDESLAAVFAAVRSNSADLATTMGDVPLRQRSLRAVFDWSWRLLDAAEQHALRRMSVFRNGCAPEATEAVVGALAPLQRLVVRSLVRREPDGRFVVHEQIRQYAAERLEQQGDITAYARHCRYYLAHAAALADAMGHANEAAVITALQHEYANLRAAWEYAVHLDDATLIGAAAPVFARLYARRNLHAGVQLFSETLTQLQPAAPGAGAARQALLDVLIGMLNAIGVTGEAHERVAELTALAQASGNTQNEAAAQVHRGDLAVLQRDPATAWEAYAAAETLCAGDPSPRGRAILAHSLQQRAGLIDWQQLPVDYRYAEQAYALYRVLDMPLHAAAALNRLGNQHRRRGDYGRSLAARRKALALIADQGDVDVGPGILNDLGELYMLLGDYAAAREVFERGLGMARRLGALKMELCILEGLGRTLFHLGELDAARERLADAMARSSPATAVVHQGYCLTTLGYVAERAGDRDAAAAYYHAALSWWATSGHCSDAIVEPRCGLARVALAAGKIGEARDQVEQVLPYLAGAALQDALEPMWVHWSCYTILHAAGDPRAAAVLAHAHDQLLRQARQLHTPALRNGFLTNVLAHRAICAARHDTPSASSMPSQLSAIGYWHRLPYNAATACSTLSAGLTLTAD
jgi:predicted ATPase